MLRNVEYDVFKGEQAHRRSRLRPYQETDGRGICVS